MPPPMVPAPMMATFWIRSTKVCLLTDLDPRRRRGTLPGRAGFYPVYRRVTESSIGRGPNPPVPLPVAGRGCLYVPAPQYFSETDKRLLACRSGFDHRRA